MLRDLIEQLKYHCIEWKNKLGIQLASDTRNIVNEIEQTLKVPQYISYIHRTH